MSKIKLGNLQNKKNLTEELQTSIRLMTISENDRPSLLHVSVDYHLEAG